MQNSILSNLSIGTDAVRLDLIHPATGVKIESHDGQTAHIMLRSVNSDATDDLKREQLKKSAMRGTRKQQLTLEQVRHDSAAAAAACTESWVLIDPVTKEILDYPATQENKLAVYSNPSMVWVTKQVDQFLADDGNFMQS